MKKLFAIVIMIFALGIMFTSCTSSKAGCKATQGMIGYK